MSAVAVPESRFFASLSMTNDLRYHSLHERIPTAMLLAASIACSNGAADPAPIGATNQPGGGGGGSECVAGQSYFGTSNYIEYIAGDVPVIVLAPHGGSIRAADMPNRANPDTLRDLNTEELARAIDTAFVTLTGHHPHVVICRVHRIKIDCNRDRSVGAGTDPEAIRAWGEFHQFIETAKLRATTRSGRALVVDMHGHGHAIQRLELGYLIDGAQLALSDATLDALTWRDSISVRELLVRTNRRLTEVLKGPQALGTLLAARGFPSVPSAADPEPNGAPYFNGGYNTLTHGSIARGTVSAIQIEANFTGVRDNATSRHRFAEALAAALRDYLAHWLDLAL